ncbi:MAG: hypothetical protein AAF996_03685 [Pseudomonadota bacterium]
MLAKPMKTTFAAGALAATGLLSLGGCATGTALAAGSAGEMAMQAAGIPQFQAFLPNKAAVPATEEMAIDGVWTISTIGKKIRIDQGRAYAVDPWLHMFTLKVQPDMVVMQNISQTSGGAYVADDLPLMGKATIVPNASGSLDVTVQGALGPATYQLVPYGERTAIAPVEEDDPLADCQNYAEDPNTGDIVCADI